MKWTTHGGDSIFVEVWSVPEEHFGSFLAGIPAPLGIGKVQLVDGRWDLFVSLTGFMMLKISPILRIGGNI